MQNNNRYSKYVALVALLIAIVGVSLGFAAYSNTVTIKAAADYRAPDEVNVAELSVDQDEQEDGSVVPTTDGATADTAVLTDTQIQNIKVHFTAPDQSATYSFYAVNPNAFIGYLNSVVLGSKTCTAAANNNGSTTTASLIADACEGIMMTVTVGSGTFTESNTNISSHTIDANDYEPITVTIEYLDGSAVADGNFDVSFGDTTILYGTTD